MYLLFVDQMRIVPNCVTENEGLLQRPPVLRSLFQAPPEMQKPISEECALAGSGGPRHD